MRHRGAASLIEACLELSRLASGGEEAQQPQRQPQKDDLYNDLHTGNLAQRH